MFLRIQGKGHRGNLYPRYGQWHDDDHHLENPGTIRAQVSVSGDTLSMAFEADRLISVLKSLTDLAAGISSQAELIGALVENYDGLWLGFELQGQ